jgi:hypothetical protein
MKKCVDCNTYKDESLFWKKKDKIVAYCKDCGKIRNKVNHEKNKEKNNKKNMEYYYKNKEALIKDMKKNYENNKEERIKYAKVRRDKIKDDILKNGLKLPDIKEKICNSCKKTLSLDMFYVKKTQNKYFEICKSCKKQDSKLYRETNKNKINIYMKKYLKSDKGTIRRINTNLRKRLVSCINSIESGSKLKNKLIDCSKDLLKKWFEYNLELDNIKFEDYGIWHIDHVIPCSAFDLTEESNIKTCFHWTNIRPLDKYKNLKKSDSILLSDIIQHEIRLKKFVKKNHIENNVLNLWNRALITSTSEKLDV